MNAGTITLGELLVLILPLTLLILVAIAVVFILARRRSAPAPLPPTASVRPTTGTGPAEKLRILTMVRDGKVGPEEADRLLGAMGDGPSPEATGPDARCPYCAKTFAPARQEGLL